MHVKHSAFGAVAVATIGIACSDAPRADPADGGESHGGDGADIGAGTSGDSGRTTTGINGIKDGDETDIDCGGRATPACKDGKGCAAARDCKSNACTSGVCQMPSFADGAKNGDETDIDCGGSAPTPCARDATCVADKDCATKNCVSSTCAAPRGQDGIKNGTETDIDCGGLASPACVPGQACEAPTDCASKVCSGKVCAIPTSVDKVQNGDETDIDCGGSAPVACAKGGMCGGDKDCATKNCSGNVCAVPRGQDGIKNGTETDIDCGGPSAPACVPGQACEAPTDCTSKVCSGKACAIPTSIDNVQNGDESDIDCGGATSPRCAQGKTCSGAASCVNGLCNAGQCANIYLFDINHILSTGQSNAVSNDGVPILSTSQPYKNVMFNSGVMTAGTCDGDGCKTYQTPSSFVPLIEGDSFFNYGVETMSSSMGNEVTNIAKSVYFAGNPVVTDFRTLVSLHGRSGNIYFCLHKGGCPSWFAGRGYIWAFDEGMMQVRSAMQLAQAKGLTYAVRGVTAIHGESDNDGYANIYPHDGTDGTPNKIKSYADALIEWQQDYETGVKALTGQTVPIPLFVSQMHGWTWGAGRVFGITTRDQYLAHKRAPGKVVLVGPGYQFPFANDWLHYTSYGERRLGEYFAKAIAYMTLTGQPWEPVRPQTISLVGSEITIKYYVPSPPLALDTTLVSAANHSGFEYSDDSGAPPGIQTVTLVGTDSVKITLTRAPNAVHKVVRYAWTHPAYPGKSMPGPETGARGNLRDSDATPSEVGQPLYNWGVTFEEAIP